LVIMAITWPPRAGSGTVKKNILTLPPARGGGGAKYIDIKSERLILGYRVTRSGSERSNLYNWYQLVPTGTNYLEIQKRMQNNQAPRICTAFSRPPPPPPGQVCTDHLNKDKPTLEWIILYIRCSTVSSDSASTS
jgi:hypothetical protein